MRKRAGSSQVVVGTLDVILAPSVDGEFLRGHDRDAAYMINVCVAEVARRRGVGKQLVHAAVETASGLGATCCMHCHSTPDANFQVDQACDPLR